MWSGLKSTSFKYREPITLPTYLNSIRYRQVTFEALSRFVTTVLEEQYPKVRYEHDDLLSALPEKIRQSWKENVVQNIEIGGRTLHSTDSHESLMRMGSDVAGSCQRVDGDPDLNRGLIGTVLDGKHKLIALCGRGERIVARSVICLISKTAFGDAVKPAPIAMVECICPPNASESSKEQLLELARSQVDRMNLRLLA
jgi:hypothetical protein